MCRRRAQPVRPIVYVDCVDAGEIQEVENINTAEDACPLHHEALRQPNVEVGLPLLVEGPSLNDRQ